MIKVYHGTECPGLRLGDPDSKFSKNSTFGPGIYFTDDIDTARQYGSNLITLEVDESKLVNGYNYKFRDISKYRDMGYIGAYINLADIVHSVVIWNIKDITDPDRDESDFIKWLDQWYKDNSHKLD